MAAGVLGTADRWRDDFDTSNRAPHNTSAAVCLVDMKGVFSLFSSAIIESGFGTFACGFALDFGA